MLLEIYSSLIFFDLQFLEYGSIGKRNQGAGARWTKLGRRVQYYVPALEWIPNYELSLLVLEFLVRDHRADQALLFTPCHGRAT